MSHKNTIQQDAIVRHFQVSLQDLLVEAVAGAGKCLGAGTPVMLANGWTTNVEWVKPGDRLMGPDGKPRMVLATNTGRGPLFRITPVKGDSWVCNDAHVMTLMGTNRHLGEVRDVSLIDLIQETQGHRLDRDWKLWRAGVDYPAQDVPVDPYFAGLWLGDGTLGEPAITNREPEIQAYCEQLAEEIGYVYSIKPEPKKNSATIRLKASEEDLAHKTNKIRQALRESDQFVSVDTGDKQIPLCYLLNTREVRLQLLAGLLDTDGYLTKGYYEIATKSLELNEHILYLARSLGFAAYSYDKISTIKSIGFSGAYKRITITGNIDEIPCRVARRKAAPRKQIKRVDVVGFTATPIGEGDYFGFTLDGDGRFLLGDFTVTHNSTTMLQAILKGKDLSTLVCAFNKRIQLDMEFKLQESGFDFERRSCAVRTLHSLGLEILRYYWPGVKMGRRVGDAIAARCFHGSPRHRYHVASVVRYCKDVHPRIFKEDPDRVVSICQQRISDLKILDNPVTLHAIVDGVNATMKLSLERRDEIDFADMLWLPLVLELQPKSRYKRIIVDEAQDLNAGQYEMVERLVAPNGSIAMVGDLRQGIYEFRGADGPAIWEKMRARGALTLPLTCSFRCARAIVAEAKRLVPEIESLPTAPEGIVDEIMADDLASHVQVGDFVLSRTNADLISLAVDTWIKGVQVVVEGSDDLLDELLQILREKLNTTSPERYQRSLLGWYKEQLAKAEKKDSTYNERLEDWYAILGAVGNRVGPTRIEQALRGVFGSSHSRQPDDEDTFIPEASGTAISFSTVHKAKGLEARRVFLLQESFRQHRPKVPLELVTTEEWNIEYVGITRAKEHLTWVRLPWHLEAVDDVPDDHGCVEGDEELEDRHKRALVGAMMGAKR